MVERLISLEVVKIILGVGRLLSLQKGRPLSGKSLNEGTTSSWHTEAMFSVDGEISSTGRDDSLEFRSSVFPVSLEYSHMTPSQITVTNPFPISAFVLTIDNF